MEYDPASPTDEPEDLVPAVDLSSIPLPDIEQQKDVFLTSINDIPLPPTDFNASEIPLPPAPTVENVSLISKEILPTAQPPPPPPPPPPPANVNSEGESASGPLKFSLRGTAKSLGQDTSSESGVFETPKDAKNSEARVMPKLQALMKRSKPSQLRVGVLPSKTKVPAAEAKTELFLPTKETDENNGLANAVEVAASVASAITAGSLQTASTASNELLTNAMREVNALNSFAHMASAGNVAHVAVEAGRPDTIPGNLATNVPTGTANHIPNLMSLTVQPVPTAQTSALASDASAVLRQPKVSIANMQFVNPQKLRSAQMIATPLIANPAIAAQPHHAEDLPKSRDGRRRSRSRSRRRSHSGRRSSPTRRSRRRHSSSSDESPPKHSSRGYQRRSRSRHSSEERYSRSRRDSRGYDRDRRDRDRRREDSFDSDRRRRNDKAPPERRIEPRTSSANRHGDRSRRRSDSRDRSLRARSKRSPVRDKHSDLKDRERHSKGDNTDRHKSRQSEKKRSRSPSDRGQVKQKRSRPSPERHASEKNRSKPKGCHGDPKPSNIQKQVQSSGSDAESSDGSSSSDESVESKYSGAVKEDEAPSEDLVERSGSCSSSEQNEDSSQPDHEDIASTVVSVPNDGSRSSRSLSARESELMKVSLHSRNAGVGKA